MRIRIMIREACSRVKTGTGKQTEIQPERAVTTNQTKRKGR